MPLPPGTTISSYTITREVGRGGMGIVYLARDTRLDRDVAIKALPEELAADPARLERFEREARTLASLNHPNLAGIHGIEEQAGARYLVLEYVEGETIADILDRGPITLDDALELAIQIATGVEAAHEAGVIHRDLKPANIKVTPEGKAKVLDFGLARADEGSTSASSIGLSNSPTVTSPIQHSPTIPGAILGTAPYMSPEQARGRKVDKRTDIWSFAVVLYEMLTGIGPFRGETATDSIGAILHKDVDLSLLPANTPSTVKRVLTRCLARDKAQRYRDIADVRIELQNTGTAHSADIAPTRTQNKLLLPLVIFVAIAAGVGGWFLKPQPPAPEAIHVTVPIKQLQRPSSPGAFDLSPSGREIAFVAEHADNPMEDATNFIFITDLDTGATRRIEGTQHGSRISFSPDGTRLVFTWFDPTSTREEFRMVNTAGGPISTLVVDPKGITYNMSKALWLSVAEILVPNQDRSIQSRLSVDTGQMTDIAIIAQSEWTSPFLSAVIDADTVLGTAFKLSEDGFTTAIFALDLTTGTPTKILDDAGVPALTPDNTLVFVRNKTICTVPFDRNTISPNGAITPLIPNLLDIGTFCISQSGDLLYITESANRVQPRLVSTNRLGETTPIIDERRNFEPSIHFSPDERHITININDQDGAPDAVLIDTQTGFIRPYVPDANISINNGWTPDGRLVVTQFFSPNHGHLEVIDPSGQRPPEILMPEEDNLGMQFNASFTPDGKYAVMMYVALDGREEGIYAIDLSLDPNKRTAIPVIATPANEDEHVLSRDGKWLAYCTDASGKDQVVMQAFDLDLFGKPTSIYPVSFEGGHTPAFSPDASELFFLDTNRNLMSVEIQHEPSLSISSPKQILPADKINLQQNFGWKRIIPINDAQAFAYIESPADAAEYTSLKLILNWATSLDHATSKR